MPVCIWTGRSSDRAVPVPPAASSTAGAPLFALPEHADDVRRYRQRVERWGTPMLLALLGLTGVLLVAAVGGSAFGWSDGVVGGVAGASVAAMGLVMVVFPFATPQMVGAFGIRRSVRIARGLGLLTAALGVGIVTLG